MSIKESRAKYYAANKERYRHHKQKRKLKEKGITKSQFDKMLEDQSGACAICKNPPTGRGRWNSLYIDHSHSTGSVRGLLCGQCNSGLGMFEDSVSSLESAISYLRRSSGIS